MNITVKTLIDRCSTKRFLDTQVPDDLLDQVLEAGLHAASGMNRQQTVMVAVRDKETRDALERMNSHFRGDGTDTFYGAPCVIVVLAQPEGNTWVEDGALVMGNLLNAATAVGLGSCWIHRARETFACPEGKALLRKWGLPETMCGIGNCVLGYPEGAPVRKPRREGRILKID